MNIGNIRNIGANALRHDTSTRSWHNRSMINIAAQIANELDAIAAKQVPFAASLALNRTATGARDFVRGNLPKRFKLRNQWTMRGIQAKPSTKSNLMAVINAPGYMAIQETGGTRSAASGKALIAPAEALQTGRVVPKGKRPRALLAQRAFILHSKGGDAGVYLRYGRKRGQIRLLWWLTDDQKYEDRFQFEQDVNDYVQDRFSANFIAAMEQALESGGYAQTGSRGRQRIARPDGMSLRAYRRQQGKG